jgi:membrane protein implicated in regulation of membrane protease activity
MSWWVWIAVGALLAASEVLIGAFIVLWFGIGAVITGLLTLAAPDMHFGVQLLTAVVSGTILMILLRGRYTAKGNADEGELYTFSAGEGKLKAGPDGELRVSARGTYWVIANPEAIPEGKRIEGATVYVEAFEDNQAVLRAEAD